MRGIPPCVYATPLITYMNNATVRQQLNILPAAAQWDLCSNTVDYNQTGVGSLDVYTNLAGKYKMLKYSGDTDMVVPTYGTRNWIDSLKWTLVDDWRQFMVQG